MNCISRKYLKIKNQKEIKIKKNQPILDFELK